MLEYIIAVLSKIHLQEIENPVINEESDNKFEPFNNLFNGLWNFTTLDCYNAIEVNDQNYDDIIRLVNLFIKAGAFVRLVFDQSVL